ncbi:hypothetical protein PC112_g12758 [Phytophthora cactorum]|nr:hypothetical protein PC112_g12758 [Phytophthora cactorum]
MSMAFALAQCELRRRRYSLSSYKTGEFIANKPLLSHLRSHFLLTALLGTSFRHLSIQEGRMQLFVETLSGSPLTLSVAADASVASVKQAVEDVEYIQNFRLVCAGKQLTSGSLADYAVGECDTLKMLLSVNGGMRAKWRKKRMRRLRRKRRKMRQRAR